VKGGGGEGRDVAWGPPSGCGHPGAHRLWVRSVCLGRTAVAAQGGQQTKQAMEVHASTAAGTTRVSEELTHGSHPVATTAHGRRQRAGRVVATPTSAGRRADAVPTAARPAVAYPSGRVRVGGVAPSCRRDRGAAAPPRHAAAPVRAPDSRARSGKASTSPQPCGQTQRTAVAALCRPAVAALCRAAVGRGLDPLRRRLVALHRPPFPPLPTCAATQTRSYPSVWKSTS